MTPNLYWGQGEGKKKKKTAYGNAQLVYGSETAEVNRAHLVYTS